MKFTYIKQIYYICMGFLISYMSKINLQIPNSVCQISSIKECSKTWLQNKLVYNREFVQNNDKQFHITFTCLLQAKLLVNERPPQRPLTAVPVHQHCFSAKMVRVWPKQQEYVHTSLKKLHCTNWHVTANDDEAIANLNEALTLMHIDIALYQPVVSTGTYIVQVVTIFTAINTFMIYC